MDFSSKLITEAVDELSKLPGIGRKTAIRMALYLLKQPEEQSSKLSQALYKLRSEIRYCKNCNNVSDTEICEICSDKRRQQHLVCVVENIRDVIAIESTQQYNGTYHVLGSLISPVNGIGPDQLPIDELVNRLEATPSAELILALNSHFEGETTAFYIARKVRHLPVKVTSIARGIAVGSELEYTDELTLGRSIQQRIPYQQSA